MYGQKHFSMIPANYHNRYNPVAFRPSPVSRFMAVGGTPIGRGGFSVVRPIPQVIDRRRLQKIRQLNRAFMGQDDYTVEPLTGGWVAVVPEGSTVTDNLATMPQGTVVSDIWGNIIKAVGPISQAAGNIIKALKDPPKVPYQGAPVPGMRYDPNIGRYIPTASSGLPPWTIPAVIGLGAAYFLFLRK